MAPRGRKPKPTHLKLVTGNPGKRALNENEPKPELSLPSPPPHLDDEAKVEWGRVSERLYALGCLAEIDRAALAAYCQAYSRWVRAESRDCRDGKAGRADARPDDQDHERQRHCEPAGWRSEETIEASPRMNATAPWPAASKVLSKVATDASRASFERS